MSDREAAIREGAEIAVMVAHYEPEALAAIFLEVRAELAAAREALAAEKRDRMLWAVSNSRERQQAREREERLREALRRISQHEGYGDYVRCGCLNGVRDIARAALADGEGET